MPPLPGGHDPKLYRPLTQEEIKEKWKFYGCTNDIAKKFTEESYNIGEMFFVPVYLRNKVINILSNGKGFSKKELLEKIKKYTAADIEEHIDMIESED